jgi:predicted ATPase
LLLRERQAFHRSLVEALQRLATASPSRERYLEDLAYHAYEAGMWEQALSYQQEAGERALSLYALQAAIEHFTRAMEAAHHLSRTPSVSLYLARGQALKRLVILGAHAAITSRRLQLPALCKTALWNGKA